MKQEVEVSAQCKTLVSKYEPVIEDRGIDTLALHPDQTDDPNEGVEILAGSLEEFGQGRPIYCVYGADGQLLIIEGSRLWKAAKLSGWVTVTVVILTKIEVDEVMPLMFALKSHQGRISYKVIALRYEKVKAHAQKLLWDGNEESDFEVRKYLRTVFGFKNDHYASDFQSILDSPEREYLLDQLDNSMLSFSKAIKKAKGKADIPKPDTESHKDKPDVYMCPDCPRRKAFLAKLESDQCADTIDDLKTKED